MLGKALEGLIVCPISSQSMRMRVRLHFLDETSKDTDALCEGYLVCNNIHDEMVYPLQYESEGYSNGLQERRLPSVRQISLSQQLQASRRRPRSARHILLVIVAVSAWDSETMQWPNTYLLHRQESKTLLPRNLIRENHGLQ